MGGKTKIAKYLSYKFIGNNNGKYSVIFLCSVLKLTQASYYRGIKRGRPEWNIKINKQLADTIGCIYQENKQLYGYPRIKIVLETLNIYISNSTVYRYMQFLNIKAKIRTKSSFKKPKELKNTRRIYPNIPNRNGKKYNKNDLGVTDVSYIPYGKNKFAYLSVIKDVKTGYIIDGKISEINDLKLFKINLIDALQYRNPNKILIIHSDHGIQYTSDGFNKFAKNNKIKISMSRVGNSIDNAACETFFSQLKSEHLKYCKLDSFNVAKMEIEKYMEYYNFKRIVVKYKTTPHEMWSRL